MDELAKSKENILLGQTLYSQTICTALQFALLDLIKTWRIAPDAVVGHSSGEISAAYAAGILSFDNAIIVAHYRGLYMSVGAESEISGAMMAAGLREIDAIDELKPYAGRLKIAAINSPTMVTISGDQDAIVDLKNVLAE